MKNFNRGRSRGFRGKKSRFNHYRPNRSGGQGRYRSQRVSLNPLMFVKRAVDFVEVPYVSVNSFADFPLHETVQKNILEHGFDQPTPIQDQAMVRLIMVRRNSCPGLADCE